MMEQRLHAPDVRFSVALTPGGHLTVLRIGRSYRWRVLTEWEGGIVETEPTELDIRQGSLDLAMLEVE